MKFVKATVCLSVLLALGACSEKETADSHLSKAKTYSQEKKTNEAVIELKNAIRADVKSGEARFLLGQTYLSQGNGVDAVKELERAKELKYVNEKLLPLLARAYILTDADDDVIALTEAAKNLATTAASQFLAYKTLAALRSEQTELAQASVELAKSADAEGLYSKLAEAYLVFSENNFEQASALVGAVLSQAEKNPDALMLQGQVATAMKDYQQAATSFKAYLAVQPQSGIVQLLLADSLLKSGQYDEAEQYADAILAAVSSQPFANYIKAMVRFQAKDYAKASEHAETALSANFNQFNLKLVAGASAFHLKNWEQTNHHLSAIVNYLPAEHQARRMLAVSQLELGLVDDISETLQDFAAVNESDAEFLTSLSYKLLELGAVDEAKQLVEQSGELANPNAKQNARQGILKLMMNDPSGMQNLQDAVKLNPELIEAELALAFSAVQSGDIAQATAIAKKWEKQYPNKAGAFNLMATISLKQKDFAKAEQALKQSLTVEPNNVFALVEQIRLAAFQKDEALAKERAEYLIKLYPNNNKALRLYFGLHRNETALEKLMTAYQLDTADLQKGMLVSEALVNLEKTDKALQILGSFEKSAKLPKRYWQLLVLIYKRQQDESNVQLTLEKWRKVSPFHLEPIVLLADFHTNKRNYERALGVINNGFANHANNLTLQLVKMQLLLTNKELYQAKELYRTLAERDINDALKQGLQGRIYLLEKKYKQAIPKLEVLYKTYASSQNALYLASAHQNNQDMTQAISVLENYLAKHEQDDRVRAILAGMYLTNDKNKAIESYVKIAKSQPNSVVVNNNLAWLYMDNNDLDNAVIYAEKAFELAPEVANVVDTYSQVLLKKGDKRAALKKASKASELSKGKDINIQLNYVEVLIANARKNEAKTLLEKIEPSTTEQTTKKSQLVKLL